MTTPIKQPKLLNYKNLNIEKYEYLLPHKTQNGYYQSICNYRLNKNQMLPFYFETPKLKTTSGIVRIDNKFYMDFELSQSGDLGLFHDFLVKNDDNNISVCHENSKEWFRQIMPLDIVEGYYKSPVIKKTNGQLPVFRVRLPSYKGNILTEIFNVRKEKVQDINCIQEGDYLIGIIEFSGLMFMSQNFTPCYELHKIKLFKDNDTRLLQSGYIFSDMNDKIDLENNIKTDNILEDPIVNTDKIVKTDKIVNTDKKDNLNNLDFSVLNIKTVSIIPNKKTLFEMIKETSLKNFLIDETLFYNNNKNINNNNVNNNVNKIEKLKVEAKVEEKVQVKEKVEAKVEAKVEIQDIDNIDLDVDYNLESPILSSSPNNFIEDELKYNQIDNDILTILDDYENLEKNNEDQEEEEEEENEEEENDEEDKSEEEDESESEENNDLESDEEDLDNNNSNVDIDYETLDDLEVIVFDE